MLAFMLLFLYNIDMIFVLHECDVHLDKVRLRMKLLSLLDEASYNL